MSPVSDSYKKEGLAPGVHRKTMCHMALQKSPWIALHSWEMDQIDRWTPTKLVVQRMREDVCNRLEEFGCTPSTIESTKFLLVCGGDLLAGLSDEKLWSDDDLDCFFRDGICVLPRQGTEIDEVLRMERVAPYQQKIHVLPYDMPNSVSSTLVRHLLKNGGSADSNLSSFVDLDVLDYIYCHGLYDTRYSD